MNVKRIIVEALMGALAWTLLLTPYTVIVMKVTLEQYLWWLLMEFTLVPPCAPIVYRLTNHALKKTVK